jgi:hypothetical protein
MGIREIRLECPQRLKPRELCVIYGTTKVVPSMNWF